MVLALGSSVVVACSGWETDVRSAFRDRWVRDRLPEESWRTEVRVAYAACEADVVYVLIDRDHARQALVHPDGVVAGAQAQGWDPSDPREVEQRCGRRPEPGEEVSGPF